MEASFEIFVRKKSGIDFIHAGTVEAQDKKSALEKAKKTLVQAKPGVIAWVVKTSDIIVTDPEDSELLFDPAADKEYRHASFYDLPDGIEHM